MTPDDLAERMRVQRERYEALADAANVLPGVWRRMFVNMQTEGFTRDEAMEILKTFVGGNR